MMFVNNFIGVEQLSDEGKSLVYRYLTVFLSNSFFLNLSGTFYILFAIDFGGFALASIMTAVMLFTQLVFDYPSGSLGDWIGQRWVLALSYLGYSVAYLILIIAQSFPGFIVVAIFMGFAEAQASGTLQTWLESNYQEITSDIDPDRKLFGFTVSRIDTLNYLVTMVSIIIGGIIATEISRRTVFFLQVGTLLVLAFLAMTLIKNLELKEPENPVTGEKKILIDYFKYFKGGISFVLNSRTSFFFIVGLAIFNVSWYLWGSLILFPLYFGYSGSDAGAALFRSTSFALTVVINIFNANISKRFSVHHYPRFLFLHALIFYPAYIVLFTLLPMDNTFNLLGVLLVLLIQNLTIAFILNLGVILQRRIMIDLIPSENRNTVYSLIPTIAALIGIPVLPLAGNLIDSHGLITGIVVCFISYTVGSLSMTYAVRYKAKMENKIRR
ncbi:MAG: MFS transporter [Candidatus Hodarchaeales archaeon]|jgi:MFS family permease